MGKGDIKTRRGKLFNKSFGVTRPRKVTKQPIPPKKKTSKKPPLEGISAKKQFGGGLLRT